MNGLLYLVFQISVLCEKIDRLWELKQLQTSSSRFALTLPRHQSTFPLALAFFSGIRCLLILLLRRWWLAWVLSLSFELVCLLVHCMELFCQEANYLGTKATCQLFWLISVLLFWYSASAIYCSSVSSNYFTVVLHLYRQSVL